MHLAVGQVWVVHCPRQPQSYWLFEFVAETWWEGTPYYVGLKCGIPPTSLQVVVFDQQGQSVEGGPFAYDFRCVRRSRRKKEHRDAA